jgi:hypothetical protein
MIITIVKTQEAVSANHCHAKQKVHHPEFFLEQTGWLYLLQSS